MSRVAEDKSISKMGKTTCCPTGPNIVGINVVAINGVGNGKGCDHGKSRFVIDTVLSDMRLIGRIPPEKVREKFEAVNEGFINLRALVDLIILNTTYIYLILSQ